MVLVELMHTSPPSPELDFPPSLFIAIAIASWVSLEMAPRDMPPVQNRCTMLEIGSTFSKGMGALLLWNSSKSRRTCSSVTTLQNICFSYIGKTHGFLISLKMSARSPEFYQGVGLLSITPRSHHNTRVTGIVI
jgi:hypothetical protein